MWDRCGQGGLNSEVLRDMPLIMLNDRGRLLLVGAHDRTQVFGVELARELGGADQVTEQHRELAVFGRRGPVGGLPESGQAQRLVGKPRRRPQRETIRLPARGFFFFFFFFFF